MVLKNNVQIDHTGPIFLTDVADFNGVAESVIINASHLQVSEPLKRGEQKIISVKDIIQILRPFQMKIESSHVHFILPKELVLELPKKAFDVEAVRAVLFKDWQKQCEDCRFLISDLQMPMVKIANFEDWNMKVKAEIPKGSFSYPVQFFSHQNKNPETYWLTGRLDVLRRVAVANRAIYFGERLTEDDFRFEYRDVTYANDGAAKEADLLNHRIKISLRVNDIIWRGHLEREKALSRGQVVRIRMPNKGFDVSLDAQAEQDGFIGDVISVKNLKSQKLLSGRVTGRGEVVVQ
jgi:flagella basal body P-ring formation protein FlgA